MTIVVERGVQAFFNKHVTCTCSVTYEATKWVSMPQLGTNLVLINDMLIILFVPH